MFENKKIFILGMAKSGYEAAKFLSKYDNEIVVTDGKEQDASHIKELEDLGVKVVISNNQVELLDNTFDLVIKNPGIKYDNACVVKAKELNIPVINELEMAYHFLNKNCNIIGVTGSNGKTTTVTLIYNFLKEAGLPVHLGGNIGFPLTSLLNDIKDNDYLVIEISDHQLCDMYEFKTNISVVTNIFEEVHIDFHDSFLKYKNTKKKIFNNHTKNDIAIINYDNFHAMDISSDIPSKKFYFSNQEKEDCYIENNSIYYQGEKVISLSEIKLKGNHNYQNIMAAILVGKQLGISNEIFQTVLSKFTGVEHRIEYVCDINGVSYYNDSKSTNNKATITALSSFDNPTILLMGGFNRNLPFDELKDYMKNVKEIICYGETKEQIKQFAFQNHVPCIVLNNLKESILKAYNDSIKGDTVLLSPACASWDQYQCFEDRGNEFKSIVIDLKEQNN